MRRTSLYLLFVLAMLVAGPARGQDLIRMFQQAQFEANARRFLDSTGLGAHYLPLDIIPPRTDTLRYWWDRIYPRPQVVEVPQKPVFRVNNWKAVRRIERRRYERRFEGAHWAFQGTRGYLPIDTAYTRVMRGKMEARFGPPTLSIVDIDERERRSASDYIQFEYWLVANDSVLVRVIDPGGPFDRGLVVATDQKFRELLPDLRRELSEALPALLRPAPYVDYFYDFEGRDWFLTGFDGKRYFTDRIDKPNLYMGRPRLEPNRR